MDITEEKLSRQPDALNRVKMVLEISPGSREKGLAITKIDEAIMWLKEYIKTQSNG